MILKISLRIIASLLISNMLFAFEVTHLVRPHSTYETATLNSSCSTIRGTSFSSRCNPALFPYSKSDKVSLSVIGKADGDSIDNGRDLIFDPISEGLIRKLFEERNFNSFTFSSDISFKTSLFEISYSPYYLLADLFIFNPAFPEISIHLVNRESLQVSQGWKLGDLNVGDTIFEGSIGANLFYYEHSYVNTVFSLFDLTNQKPEELIQFSSVYGISGDIGYSLFNNTNFIPDVSLQVKNIGSKVEENESFTNSAFRQSPRFLFETYSTLGLGKKLDTVYGDFSLNLEIPFVGYFEESAFDQQMLGMRYSLKLFSVFLGLGENYKNIGMRFNSRNFNVGITYSKEKDMGNLQASSENAIYTGIDINL